jgi:hypothetical protein
LVTARVCASPMENGFRHSRQMRFGHAFETCRVERFV